MEAGRNRVEDGAFPRTRALHADLSGTRASGAGAESLQRSRKANYPLIPVSRRFLCFLLWPASSVTRH